SIRPVPLVFGFEDVPGEGELELGSPALPLHRGNVHEGLVRTDLHREARRRAGAAGASDRHRTSGVVGPVQYHQTDAVATEGGGSQAVERYFQLVGRDVDGKLPGIAGAEALKVDVEEGGCVAVAVGRAG